MNNKKLGKIVIFGAGVAGLTVAHMLAPFAESIDIYEKNSSAGGLARTEGDDICDTKEISWRVYFHFYQNLFNIMREIPSFDNVSVYDHLVKYRNVFIPNVSNLSFYNNDQLFKIAKNFVLSNERIDSMDDIPWRTFIGNDDAEIPQWLGMDRFKGSMVSVQRIGIEQLFRKGNKEDYVLDGPTNKIWFDPWVKYLQNKNVKFHFNSKVESISVNDQTKEITDACIIEETIKCIKADLYILALPVEQVAKLVPTLVPSAEKLSEMSKQIQLAFQLHIKPDKSGRMISIGYDKDGSPFNSFLIRYSPWALIVESKTISWDKHLTEPCSTIQWSITICQANVPGIKIKKPLIHCTEDEAKQEIIAQMMTNKYLINYLQNENPNINIIEMLQNAIWSSDPKSSTVMSTYKLGNILQTDEPKFTNNAGTKKLRPTVEIGPNAYLASAYVRETIDVFSMEAAAIAGKLVSAKILHDNVSLPNLPPRPYPILEIFRTIDSLLFKYGLPDIVTMILILIVVILFSIILWLLLKWLIEI